MECLLWAKNFVDAVPVDGSMVRNFIFIGPKTLSRLLDEAGKYYYRI